MKSILVLFAHPTLEKSRVQRAWLERIRDLASVEIRDLYELYPEFDVDVPAEQTALLKHDIIVLQHPLYWYSTPALIKQWLDLVLEHGWAYGSGGTALQGKALLSAISTGGKEESYQPEGLHQITLNELLAPLRQTARLCHMQYLPPFVAHGAFAMTPSDIQKSADDYRAVLISLRDETHRPQRLPSADREHPPTASAARRDEENH